MHETVGTSVGEELLLYANHEKENHGAERLSSVPSRPWKKLGPQIFLRQMNLICWYLFAN